MPDGQKYLPAVDGKGSSTRLRTVALSVVVLCLTPIPCTSFGDDPSDSTVDAVHQLRLPGVIRTAIGVTRRETEIACFVTREDFNLHTPKTRVLLVGGLDGTTESVESTLTALRWFHTTAAAAKVRKRYLISAVPCINPDGIAAGKGPKNLSGGNPDAGFPPKAARYSDGKTPEAAYLWRWIAMHAPDLVVVVRNGEKLEWQSRPAGAAPLASLQTALKAQRLGDPTALAAALSGLRVVLPRGGEFLPELLSAMQRSRFNGPSPRREQLQKLVDRPPRLVGGNLAAAYGKELSSVTYIPAVAVIGRMGLGPPRYLEDARAAAEPYFLGDRPAKPGSPVSLAGHLVFAELARLTRDPDRRVRYIELVSAAAEVAFDGAGKVDLARLSSSKMSDAVFMAGPILSRAAALTGEQRFFDASAAHIRNLRKMVHRKDGLYRHWPGVEAAWGRGNGFPAVGLAMCLSDFPASHPARRDLLNGYREHMNALAKHQDPNGCWHQIIDRPGSYRELTCTCMIGFAMLRGIRKGWLPPEQFRPVVDRAWYAVKQRIAPGGELVDVCTGTGKQKDLRAYYDRKAIRGRDARGGAMALLFTSEVVRAGRDSETKEKESKGGS